MYILEKIYNITPIFVAIGNREMPVLEITCNDYVTLNGLDMEMHSHSHEVLKVADAIYFTFCDGMQAEQGHSDHIHTYPHAYLQKSKNKTFYFIYLFIYLIFPL